MLPPVPAVIDHKPVPKVGLLPARITVVTPQVAELTWSGPALAAVALVIVTKSSDGVHGPWVILHLNTYVPGITPATNVVAELGSTITGLLGPLTLTQVPVSVALGRVTFGEFIVNEVTPQSTWSVPASAVVITGNLVKYMVSDDEQVPL